MRIPDGVGDDPILNMRGRVEQCRRLSKTITDSRTVEILLQMAREIEADIERLEANGAENPNSRDQCA